MTNIARWLTAAEDQLQATCGRTILCVIDADESEAQANERLERIHGPITETDTVYWVNTGVPRSPDRW